MEKEQILELVRMVQEGKFERQTVEVKSAHLGVPKVRDTLSSFSNQDDGGIILFGLDESEDFTAVGVFDVQALQKGITEQCNMIEPTVRAIFSVLEIQKGIYILVAEIPSVHFDKRPAYYIPMGRTGGSFIRVGDADKRMSDYEIYNYEVTRKRIRDELRVVDGVSIEDLNKKDIADFIDKTRLNHINLVNVTDSQLLEFMGVTKNNKVTIAGLITFHDYPQYIFPQLQISVVRIPGQKIGLTDVNGVRFLANQSFTGNIKQMLKDSYDFIVRNLSVSTIIGDDGMRHDKYEYPLLAIREGLLNSLEHRDYSKYTDGFPIRVEIYSDSLLIKSPGYLYGNSDISELGEGIFETRNLALVNILSILNLGENRYSGIPTMRAEMGKANLLPPKFYNRNDSFILELDNEVYIQNLDRASVNSVLEYCLAPRSREEIIKFVNKSRNYVLSNIISPLVKEGKLGLTIPTKPQSPFQKYYTKKDNK